MARFNAGNCLPEMKLVETVILNWRRPKNILAIVQALRRQAVPTTITLIDCHEEERYALPAEIARKVDRIHRQSPYCGALNR